MKGLALAWAGILVIVLMSTLVVYYMTAAEPVYRNVMVGDSKTISFINDALLLEKMYDEGIKYIVPKAALDYLKEGAGYSLWTSAITIDDLKGKLQIKLTDMTNLNENYKVTGDVKVSAGSDCTIDILSKCFHVESNKEFLLTGDSGTVKFTKNINQKIDSNYFKTISIGLNLVGNELYAINKANFIKNTETTFSVINNNDLCNNIVAKSIPSCDATYCYAYIENIVKTSTLCGYKNNLGAASVTTNDASVVAGRIAAVINSLNSDLTSRYGVNVAIISGGLTQSANSFTLKASAKIDNTLQFSLSDMKFDLKYYDINAKDIVFTGTVMPKGISLVVKNEGTLTMSNVKYRVYVGGNSVGTGTIASINPGTTLTVATGATVSTSGKNVQIVVDTDYTYAEINEANNWVSRTS